MDDDESQPSPGPATFEGKLALGDFAYGGADAGPRRSLRISKPSLPSQTPPKRKATPRGQNAKLPGREEDDETINGTTEDTALYQPTKKNKKQKRAASSYAPPSTYAHLPLLPDAIATDLLVLFIGLNPGIQTARSGHAYAHPSNLFWKLLYSSGVTPRPCAPQEDRLMPQLFSLGLTNIVSRPSRNGGELSKQEMDAGVATLEDKARRWRPESMCVVGKSIWESIWRVRHQGKAVGAAFKYGWQDECENMGVIEGEWAGARVFVATSTSGLAASLSPAQKQEIWSQLGSWVKTRRAEREAAEE